MPYKDGLKAGTVGQGFRWRWEENQVRTGWHQPVGGTAGGSEALLYIVSLPGSSRREGV